MMRSAPAAMKPSVTGVGMAWTRNPSGGDQEIEDADHQRQGGGQLDVGGGEGLGEVVE
jgi:hypothetical protein